MSDDEDQQVEIDPLAPTEMLPGDLIDQMIREKYPEELERRPRDRMFDYALGRMSMIQHRVRVEGKEFSSGWLREYLMMRDVRRLIEWMEQEELKRLAAAEREKGKRRRS